MAIDRLKTTGIVTSADPRLTTSVAESPHRLSAIRRLNVSLSASGTPSNDCSTSPTLMPACAAGDPSCTMMTRRAAAPAPTAVEYRVAYIFGSAALGIGIVLAVFIFWALLGSLSH